MRKFKKIQAVLLATALFANPCLGNQSLQEVHAEEAEEDDHYQEVTDRSLSAASRQTTVNLYFVYDAYKDILSLPDGYENTYQIVLPDGVTGDVQYEVDGDSAAVDENGIISPTQENSGQSTVHVTCGDYTQTITVNVTSYDNIYVNDTLDKIYSEITSGKDLTQAELAEAFTQYAADHYNYSASCSSLSGIIITGGGDCWANTALINALCKKAGIESRSRYAAIDSGAGSTHMNNILRADGKYYIADAGFSGQAPRNSLFEEEPEGLCMVNRNSLAQYDAFETEAVIPETVNGTEITALLNYLNGRELSVFAQGVEVTSVSLPKTITNISPLAFHGCESLSRISVAKENPGYMDIDGILYAKDGTVVRVPQAMTDVKLSDSTTSIGDYAFSGSKASEITIPDGVTSIGSSAFYLSQATVITIPESVTTIKDRDLYNVTIRGTKGSYAEQYAAENGLTFIDVKTENTDRDTIEAEMAQIREEISIYSEDNVKSSNKQSVEELAAKIDQLSAHPGLKDPERKELDSWKADCEKYLARIEAVAGEISRLTETVDKYMAEKPEDVKKEDVKQTSAEIDVYINSENLTDEEKTALNTLKSRCSELLTGRVKKGDIDKNGNIDLIDLMMCLNHVSKKKVLTGDAFLAADVDGNGSVGLSDLMRILNYVSRKSKVL